MKKPGLRKLNKILTDAKFESDNVLFVALPSPEFCHERIKFDSCCPRPQDSADRIRLYRNMIQLAAMAIYYEEAGATSR